MKKKIILFILLLVLMLFLPLMTIIGGQRTAEETQKLISSESKASEKEADSDISAEDPDRVFRILDTSTGKVISVEDREFCYGALAYEMPASFHEEALKAQTAALYTFFSRKRKEARENPSEELRGADFAADLSSGQFYISDEQRRREWGSLFEKTMEKIKGAVDAVYGEVITDKSGELIDACYHSASAGRTEAAADIFGTDREYLQPVPSPWDIDSPDFITKKAVSTDEFKKLISGSRKSIKFSASPEKYVSSVKKTASGSVTEAVICGEAFTGSQLRSLFGLRSAAFDLSYADGKFVFTVKGYGHGVGMSQWGAQGMAQQGSSYREILKHYYSMCNVQCSMYN